MFTISDIKGSVLLNNGVSMPYLGLGVYKMENNQEVQSSIDFALKHGYRLIDTAALYYNESGVGHSIRNSGIARDQIFVTTKVWNSNQGYDSTLRAFDESIAKLKLDYIDLYLIHWPVKDKYKETWRALEKIYAEKRVHAIGISNFLEHHIKDLFNSAHIKPMVNQIEFHPRLVQQPLLDFCQKEQIVIQSWSPLMQGKYSQITELSAIAEKYQKTVPQIILRWNLQKGVATIPKSSNPQRIIENANIFDFAISAQDMAFIDNLDKHQRIGADPDNFDF
ncbi:MAG TPA: aldo/keto reductase [Bacteroidales bacterium]|nr:aldo/keto reductase [Bacteroidales bacterium]